MKPKSNPFLRIATLTTIGLVLSQTSAFAATFYWDTNGNSTSAAAATGIWGTDNFWSTDSTGATATSAQTIDNTSDLIFSAASNSTGGTVTINGTQAAHSITFDDATGAITLSVGTAINLGSATAGSGLFFTNATGNANIISTPIILNSAATAISITNSGTQIQTIGAITGAATTGTQTVTASSTNSGGITFNGIIGDGASGGKVALTVNSSGAGVITASGANTYTGGTTINAGTLALSGGANRLLSTSTVTFGGANGSSATLDVGSTNQTLSSITIPTTGLTTSMNVAIKGSGGTLTVNGAANLVFGPTLGTSLTGLLTTDMSNLSNFVYNASGNTFRIAMVSNTNTNGPVNNTEIAAVTLANVSNTITTSILAVGDVGGSGGGGISRLHLGTSNTLNVGSINMGTSGRSSGYLDFASGLSLPTVTIRGTAGGTSAVTAWNVGNVNTFGTSTTKATWTAQVDLSAATVDANVTTLTIGKADIGSATGRAGIGTSTFTLGATSGGNFTIGTLNLGLINGTATNGVDATTGNVKALTTSGTFTLSNASGVVNATTINFATNTLNDTTAGTTKSVSGTFNLTNGTLNATTVQKGAQTGTGTGIAVTTAFNWTNGTIANLSGGNLTWTGIPITLTAGTHTFNASNGQSISLDANSGISGGSGITKTGGGTLSLSGANSYTGTTSVNNGTLLVSAAGTLAGTIGLTVANGAALTYTPTTVATTLNLGTASTMSLNDGSTIKLTWDTAGTGTIKALGAATVGTGAGVTLNLSGTPTSGTSYTVLQAASGLNTGRYWVTGPSGYAYAVNASAGTSVTVTPSSIALTTAYWYGGLSGATQAWAASDAAGNTNWATTSSGTGTGQAYVPGSVSSLVFSSTNGGTTAPVSSTLGAPMSVAGLTINSGIGLALNNDTNSNTLTIGTGGITLNNGANAVSIAAPVVLGGAQTWTNNSSNGLTFTGTITGGGNALTTAGTGPITVSLSGTSTINTLTAGSGTLKFDTAGKALTVAGNLTLSSSNLDIAQDVIFSGNGTGAGFTSSGTSTISSSGGKLVLNNTSGPDWTAGTGGTVTISAPITDNGNTSGIDYYGGGTFIITGTNNYSGTTSLGSPIVRIGVDSVGTVSSITSGALGKGTVLFGAGTQGAGGLSSDGTSPRTILNPITVNLSANLGDATKNGKLTFAGAVNLAAAGKTLTINSDVEFSGVISGSNGFTKAGSAVLTLSNTNAYTGKTTVATGTLSFNAGDSSATADQQLGKNSDFDLGVASTSSGTLLYTGGTGTLAKNINALGNGNNTVENNGGGTLTLSGTLAKNGTKLVLKNTNSGSQIIVSNAITGISANSDLIISGGTTTLNAANTYVGPTSVIGAGTLALGINNAIPSNSGVTLGDATTTGTLNMIGFTNTIGSLSFGVGGGTLKMAANQTGSAQLAASGAVAFGTSNTIDLTGMGASAGLYKLVSGSSLSGTFGTVTGLDSAYTLKYGTVNANELDAQHKATISLALGSNAANVHVGSQTVNLSIGNSAPTGSADLSYTLGGLIGSGTRAPQVTSAATGTYTAVAGVNSFNITASDAAATNSPRTVAFSQTGYNLAAASTSQTVNVGSFRIGTAKTAGVTLANTAPANASYTETLSSGAFSGTTSNFTATGSVSGIAGGGTGSGTLLVGVGAGLGAGPQSGTTTLALNSNEVNSSGLGTTTLTAQTITINATGYNTAVAGTIANVSVGKTRVNGTFSGTAALSISNTAPSGSYTEGLNATVGSTSGGASGSGLVSNLSPGSPATSILVGLAGANTSTSGLKTGSVTIDLASSGTNSGLSDLGLASQTVGVSGLVYDYADAVFSKSAGTGSFSGSGSSYSLDFGTGLALNTTYTATIQLANYLLSSYQDNLGGSYGSLPSSEFASGVEGTSIASLVAGTANTFTITFNTGSTGNFSDTLTFTGASQQSGLSDATLGAFTINLTANAVPEPDVSTLIGGIGMFLLLRRRR